MTKRLLLALAAPAIPTLIFISFLLFYPNRDLLILWPREAIGADALLPLVGGVSLYAIAAWCFLRQGARGRSLGLILLATLGALTLQVVVTRAGEPDVWVSLLRRTYAWKANGYWSVGASVTDVNSFLADYATVVASYPVHVSRHPPGLALVFWLGARLFETAPGLAEAIAAPLREQSCQSLVAVTAPAPQMAAALFGAAIEIALAMMAVVPLYALVKRLAGADAASWATALYPLIPGFGMWVSQFDRGFAFLTGCVLLLTDDIVVRNSYRRAFTAGIVLSIASFLSYGLLPLAAIATVYALARIAQTTQTRPATVRQFWELHRSRLHQGGLTLLGMSTIWLATSALFRLDAVALWRAVFDSHLGIQFPYWPFVVWHPWDIITFCGIPLVSLALTGGWRRAAPLTAAFAVTLGVLSLLHLARSETGRVWLFFAPLAVGAAAILISANRRSYQLVTLGLVCAQLVVQAAVLRPMREIGLFPEDVPSSTIPPTAMQIDTRFGSQGQIALRAYEYGVITPGRETPITLYWERMSSQPIEVSYTAFVHIATDESDQNRIGAHDGMPVQELFPTTCWQPGVIVRDERMVPIRTDTIPGAYPVFVGLYDSKSTTRAPAFASPPTREVFGSLRLPEPAVAP